MIQDADGQRHDRSALVLYGSETGNSQDLAEQLGRTAERLHFVTRVSGMDNVELRILSKYTIVIFMTSTTGQGEFPKNAQKLWKSLLRKRLPPNCLGHVSFTTFGLGDSSYAQFNYAARKLHKRIAQLGGKEIYTRGEADEQHNEGIDGTFLSWSADFSKHLLEAYPLPEGVIPIPPEVLLPPKLLLKLKEAAAKLDFSEKVSSIDLASPSANELDETPSPDIIPNNNSTGKMKYVPYGETEEPPSMPPPCPMLKEPSDDPPESIDRNPPADDIMLRPGGTMATLLYNEKFTPESHWQDVRRLTFVVTDPSASYRTGDTVTIYPKNFPEDVQKLIDLMEWNDVADSKMVLNNGNYRNYREGVLAMHHVPEGLTCIEDSTLRDLLVNNVDITAIPKRHFFELCAAHCSDVTHEMRLREFSSPLFTDEYYDYATRPRRSCLEILEDFPTVKLPWSWLFAIFTAIRGRQYSICNGGAWHGFDDNDNLRVEILVAIVKYKTVLKKVRQGLCSRYLSTLRDGTDIFFTLNNTTEKNPWAIATEPRYKELSAPIICIAPGTGVAPVRALYLTRARLDSQYRAGDLELPNRIGHTYVYYGGRNRNADYFFKDEYTSLSARLSVITAFSRDQRKKVYVQDRLREQGELIYKLIMENKARVFVCGSAGAMPRAVREAFVDIFEKWDGEKRGRAWAEDVVRDLVKLGRYAQETW